MTTLTVDLFLEITRGHDANTVARILQRYFTRGTNWRGCSKRSMAESICGDRMGASYTYRDRVDPDKLRAELAEEVKRKAMSQAWKEQCDRENAEMHAKIRAELVAVGRAVKKVLDNSRASAEARTCATFALRKLPQDIQDAIRPAPPETDE